MSKEIDLTESTITILLEVDGEVHLVAMDKERKEAVEFFAKNAVEFIIPTKRTQNELREYLGANAILAKIEEKRSSK